MKKISVIGSGTMGNGIAHVFAQNNFQVSLIDISEEALVNALKKISNNLNRLVKKEVINEEIKQLYRIDAGEEILANGTPYQSNVDYLRKEIKKGEHDFVCVTSQHPTCSHHTLTWLGKHELNFETVYFRRGEKKWMVECDYLIDDSPNNWKHWKNGRGGDKNFLLMNQKWNEKVKSSSRVHSIKEAIELINAQ